MTLKKPEWHNSPYRGSIT